GMLFSDTQAVTQALQPTQELRSMAMLQAWPSYLWSGYSDEPGTGSWPIAWKRCGFSPNSAAVAARTTCRSPAALCGSCSIVQWSCVQARSATAPVRLICRPDPNQGDSLVRSA